MIICHCNVVRADEIRTEVRLGAAHLEDVAARCGAALRCSGCRLAVEAVIEDEIDRGRHDLAVRSC